MSGSLGELYFALGLDSQKFDDAIKEAKKKVAELTGEASITINADASNVAKQVQEDLNKITGKKTEIKLGIDKSGKAGVEDLVKDIANAEKELERLKSKESWNTAAIGRQEGFIASLKRQLEEAKAVKVAVTEAKEAISNIAQPSQVVQHVVSEEAIADVKALTDAMKSLNEQMEVNNRLREGQQKANAQKKEESEQRRISAQWLNETRRQNKEIAQLQKEEEAMRSSVSSKWIDEARKKNAELRKEEAAAAKQRIADAKSSNKALQSQLSQLFKLEEAIKKLQNLRVRLNLSGIDQNSENFKKAALALDSYINKLQQLQGSGRALSKREVSSVLGVSMKSVIDESNRYVKEQKAIEKSLIKALSEGSGSSIVIDKKTSAMNKFKKAIIGTTNWASQLNNQLGNAFSIYAIERFIRSLYTVGGEFQKQQIALQNMIGDTAKADVIFDRMKELAVTSPFTFSELASYTKQMSAYGIEYEELYDTTKRLADISAGVGVDMSRIILAYGQVKSAEVLRGQELRQFTEAGIPLVAELAKRLEEVRGKSVAVGEVFDAISKREISFDMVKDVLFDMTDPGGRFFETQERLAESLAGKWSNLKDAWDIMIADIANGNNSTLKSLAEVTVWLVKNWEAWLPLISGAAAALGTYRAVMSVVIPLQQAFNILTKANPWIAIASGVIGAAAAIYGYATNTKTAADELKELNLELDKNTQKNREREQTANRYLDSLKAQNTSEEKRIKLLQELKQLYPSIFEGMSTEQVMLANTIELKKRIAEATKEMTLADYDNAILKNQTEIDRLRKEDWRRLTTPGRGDKHSQNDAEIKRLESINTGLRESREELAKQLAWEEGVKGLNATSTLEEYINLFGEIGKAIKTLRDNGIKDESLVKPEQGIPLDEYYDRLNSAIQKQDAIMKKFGPDTAMHKNAKDIKKVYEDAIKSIGGILGGDRNDNVESDAEKKAKLEAERVAKAFAEGVKTELSKIGSRWDLYKQLFEATGDKKFALTAFDVTPVWDEAALEMKKKFEEALNLQGIGGEAEFDISDNIAKAFYGDLYDAWKEIKDRIEKNGINLKVNAANAIKDTKSVEEQIQSLENQRDEELKNYAKGTTGYDAVAERWNKQIQELRNNLWELSPEFKKLFVDTTGMSVNQIENLRKEAQRILAIIQNGTPNNKTGMIDFEIDGDSYSIEQEAIAKLIEWINKLGEKTSEVKKSFSRLWDWINGKEQTDGTKLQFKDVAKDLSLIAQEASNAAQSISSMFDSLGDEATADAFALGGNILSGISNIGEGIASGNPFAVINGVTGIIGSIAQFHDKKLDRAIRKSQLEVTKLTNAYKQLERTIERQLGSVASDQSKKMIENLRKQRSELQKQYNLEDDKKKTDASKLQDYKSQIAELDDQIKYFYEDLASEQYGVDIKGWSSQIAEALTEAFATGEDAAKAFDNTVADILRNLATQAIQLQFIEPAMESLRKYMFGDSGIFTANSAMGTDLSTSEAAGLKNQLDKLKGQIEASNDYWDKINDAVGGILDSTEKSESGGLSKEIQGVVEEKSGLLASYINALRHDVSVKRSIIEKLAGEDIPKMSLIAQAQLTQLNNIAANTLRNAEAADRIYDLFNRVVDKGGNKLKI